MSDAKENEKNENSGPCIREWKYLRGSDFENLDREKTVVIVTCSPLEVHGPHLPLITDIAEGEALLGRAIDFFHRKHSDLIYLKLPFLYVATDVVPQAGSIKFRPSTIIRVIADLGRSLASQGFRHIWVSNFHGGPRHFVSIEIGCHKVNRKYNTRMIPLFSLLISKLTGGKNDLSEILGHIQGLEKDHLAGDMHAGLVETSLMLHLLEKYVDENYDSLERMTVDLRLKNRGQEPVHEGDLTFKKMIRGLKANLKYYEEKTYSGHPAQASAELGEKILDVFGELTAEYLEGLWKEEIPLKECRTALWKIRWAFTNPFFGWIFEKVAGHESEVW